MIIPDIIIDDAPVKAFLNMLGRNDVAYGTANAMNRTMNQAQDAVRKEAYLAAFTQRNSSLAKALTTIPNAERANKRKLQVRMMNVRDSRTGKMAGEGFIERQIAGAVKRPRGSSIAIPTLGKGLRRLTGGRLPAGKKPRTNPKLFKVGNKLVERQRKKLITRFVLAKSAKPNKRGRFDYLGVGVREIKQNIQRNWTREMQSIIARASMKARGLGLPSSRVFSGGRF